MELRPRCLRFGENAARFTPPAQQRVDCSWQPPRGTRTRRGRHVKLARVGPKGAERPALVDASMRLRALDSVIADVSPATLSRESLSALAKLDHASLPLIDSPHRYGPPVSSVGKFIGIGLNYMDHAAETGNPIPSEPIIFMKAISSIAGPDDDVPLPRGSTKMDWEIELGVVIGSHARYVETSDAMAHVAGYVIVNDISERFDQIERGGTWDKGKGHDGFGPIGPWLVTTDELGAAQDLAMTLDVSGRRCQTGNTASMIFGVPAIVAYVSRFMTLNPGDIIATGTPAGVGLGMKPPRFLSAGDQMHLRIAGLGEQRQRVVPPRDGRST
jgi:2,4-didehydro-3-deoxy-L-rhamnonate hydrolase